jgi:hypothetical protein
MKETSLKHIRFTEKERGNRSMLKNGYFGIVPPQYLPEYYFL